MSLNILCEQRVDIQRLLISLNISHVKIAYIKLISTVIVLLLFRWAVECIQKIYKLGYCSFALFWNLKRDIFFS